MIFNHRQLEKIDNLSQQYNFIVFNKIDKIIYYCDKCPEDKSLLDSKSLYILIFSAKSFEQNLKDKVKIEDTIKKLGNIKSPLENNIIEIFTKYKILEEKSIIINETALFLQKYNYYKKLFEAIMKKIPSDILGYKYRKEFQDSLISYDRLSDNSEYFDFLKERLNKLLSSLSGDIKRNILKKEIMSLVYELEEKSMEYYESDNEVEYEKVVKMLNKKFITDKKVDIILNCIKKAPSKCDFTINDNILSEAKRYYQSIKTKLKYSCIFYSDKKQIIESYEKVSTCPKFKEKLTDKIKNEEIFLNF